MHIFILKHSTNIVKKKIPVAVWKKIQPLIDQHLTLFRPLKTSEFAFHLIDLDDDSTFDFKCAFQDKNGHFKIEYEPHSIHHIHRHYESVNLDQLTQRITNWSNILQEYVDTNTFYDDSIEKRYTEYFFDKLEIQEFSVGSNPFNIESQLFISNYIGSVKMLLDTYKTKTENSETIFELEIIEKECEKIENNIKSSSANEVLKILARIWGKAHKTSLKLVVDLLKEFRKEVLKKLTTHGFNELQIFITGLLDN
jgi:hypothetical protein